MKKDENLKVIYHILAVGFALCGSIALYFALPILWLALCLAANIFCAAGAVCGAEMRTVVRKKRTVRFPEEMFGGEKQEVSEETIEVEETEETIPRIPYGLFLVALILAVVTGFVTRSAWQGLLVLFTWGGLGYPLARCILRRFDFGLSLQTGLISAGVYTALAGVIQIFVSTPDHTFRLKDSIVWVADRIKEALTGPLAQAKEYLSTQNFEDLTGEYKTYIEQLRLTLENPALLASQTVDQFLAIVPGLFAVAVLILLCIIWWGTKAALKKNAGFEVKHMGRLDNYVPNRMLTAVYMAFLLVQMVSKQDSALQIASTNIILVTSAALALSGFSLILFVINSRVRSVVLRVLLIIGVIVIGIPTCGLSVLYLLGIIATWVDLRSLLGGGTLK